MRLGISYNVFDGEELLMESIKSVRNCADHISIVYQEISNHGNECSEELVPLIKSLREEGLVDEIHKYKPDLKKSPHHNEVNKRNIGLFLSEGAECTHHMSMDSDEFYLESELEYVKDEIEKNDYDATACQMVTYYKKPYLRLEPKEEYYVSLIYKLKGLQFELGTPFPVQVDPTRRIKTNNFKSFTRDEIEMHHMSYVRKDITRKFRDSSAKVNFKENKLKRVVNHFNDQEEPEKALMIGADIAEYDLVRTNNLFNIEI